MTQHKTHGDILAIESAKGVCLFDEAGNSYIDGIASWYTCMYGHCNKFIVDRVYQQMQKLDQIVFSGFTHEPAVTLSEALIKVLPGNQQKLFFSDNGSTAVEVAIKMALQYHFNREDKRTVLLAFEEGFHGDTFGAMSVSGLSVYNGPFNDFHLEVCRIPVPNQENQEIILDRLRELLREKSIAAFVYEPLVQGAAGMKTHNPKGLEAILTLLRDNGVLLIADEVMTGFGKTGSFFASEQLDIYPDIICLSKALTAGLMPMAVTSCTQAIFDAFYSEDLAKGFFHGHTYTANPLACTAATAALELLSTQEIQDSISRIEGLHREFDMEIKNNHKVQARRQKGVIYAIDLIKSIDRYGVMRDKLYKHFMKKGIFLRPLGNTIYILPPYVITNDQLHQIYDSILSALDEF